MSASNHSKIAPNKVLVTGASGLLGVAAIEKFLAAGWKVVGVSRRKPLLPSGRDVEFLAVDLRDEKASRAAFEPLTDVTHIAYTALHEKPELVAGWSSKEQIETNNAMLRNVVEPIVRSAANFQHINILQGTSTACTCIRFRFPPANRRSMALLDPRVPDAGAGHGFRLRMGFRTARGHPPSVGCGVK